MALHQHLAVVTFRYGQTGVAVVVRSTTGRPTIPTGPSAVEAGKNPVDGTGGRWDHRVAQSGSGKNRGGSGRSSRTARGGRLINAEGKEPSSNRPSRPGGELMAQLSTSRRFLSIV